MNRLSKIKEFVKKLAFRYTKLGDPKYPYNLEPVQLAEIIHGINKAAAGNKIVNIYEVGVARGMTTRFICEHIVSNNFFCNFFCIDTFSGFTENDVEYEVNNRGKSYNDFDIFQKNFKEYSFLKPLKIDAAKFDFSKTGKVDFLFLDVDLYKPTRTVLENIKPFLGKNSVVIVDDVLENQWCDGAYDAFMDFVGKNNFKYRIAGNKCGIIEF